MLDKEKIITKVEADCELLSPLTVFCLSILATRDGEIIFTQSNAEFYSLEILQSLLEYLTQEAVGRDKEVIEKVKSYLLALLKEEHTEQEASTEAK